MTSWTQISAPAGAPASWHAVLDPIGRSPCPTWPFQRCPQALVAGRRWRQFVELVPRSSLPRRPAGAGLVYVTQLMPSVTKNQPTSFIVLAAGEHRSSLELRLQPVRTFRVSGRVAGADAPGDGLVLALESDDIPSVGWPIPAAATLTDAYGRFAFLRVPAGHYRMRARTPPGAPLSVDVPVDVEGDLDDVVATVQRPRSIHGTIRFEGTSPPPDPTDAIQLFFPRTDGEPGAPSTIAAAQTFRSAPVPVGEYLLGARFLSERFAGGGEGAWRLKDAIVDEHDMADAPIAIGAAELEDVVVTFTDIARGTISGHVRDERARPDAEASVLIFSTNSRYWSHTAPWSVPDRHGRAQVALTTRRGAFEFPSIPAGEYFLAAVPDSSDAWTVIGSPNPDLFARLAARAARVTVKDGDRLVHDLQTLE
jgi:hypothetical protein